MTYRELQIELKAYRSEGYSVPALNSIKAAIASQPVERVWKLQMMSLAKLRRYAKKAGFKHANQLKKQALIQALTA